MLALAACGAGRGRTAIAADHASPDFPRRFDRLLILPVFSLGNLQEFRRSSRRSLALAFSARADSIELLSPAGGYEEDGDRKPGESPASDTLHSGRCGFEAMRRRIVVRRDVGRSEAEGLYALCADMGYRRRPAGADSLQVATAAGRIWSGRSDSVVWRDSAAVEVRMGRSELSPETIEQLLREAILRLRDRLP